MNYYVKQLVVDVEESIEKLVTEIEQIQEDIPESDLDFLRLEEMREKLVSVLEISEKLRG